MAHAQKPYLVFQRNRRVRCCQFTRLLAVEEFASADSDCIDRVPTYSARLLATHPIRIFPLHFPSRASPCVIRFRMRYISLTHELSSDVLNSECRLKVETLVWPQKVLLIPHNIADPWFNKPTFNGYSIAMDKNSEARLFRKYLTSHVEAQEVRYRFRPVQRNWWHHLSSFLVS